jgi:hypothetical protein
MDMQDVLKKVRERFNPEWLFPLGCYHPKRREIFQELEVWGSDYKGWIFQYKKRERLIQLKWEEIASKLMSQGLSEHQLVSVLNLSIKERSEFVKQHEIEEHKKSVRNVSLEDRAPELIKLDSSIRGQLENIKQNAYLDGTKRSIEKLNKEISQLAQKTEQQIRYEQVRTVIEGLSN